MTRCDRCNAPARTLWVSDTTGAELSFCGHHGGQYWVLLIESGWSNVELYTAKVAV